jgi:hypothetical protein
LVIRDPKEDRGYQILGENKGIEERAMMNGCIGEKETTIPLPQIKRKLSLDVQRIPDFKNDTHTDRNT